MNWKHTSVSTDGTHHLVDGAPLYPLRFDAVLPFRDPGLAPARLAGLAWHIALDGRPAYDRRFEQTYGFYEGLAAVASRDGWHHIRPDGSDLSASRYEWCGNFQDGRCAVRDHGGRYLHVTTNGAPAYADRWRYAGDFREGRAVVQADDGRSTHIDGGGNPVHGRWFFDLDVFHKGFACARDAAGWTHVDSTGRPAYRRRFTRVEPFYNGQARVEQGDGRRVIINEHGDTLLELRPADLEAVWPRDRPVAMVVRHAERPPLPVDANGDDLPLTESGALAAHTLGARIGPRLASVVTSPVRRCRETATAIAIGAGAAADARLEPLLGAPGAFVDDAQLAWGNWQRLGNEGVIEHLVRSDDALPGMVVPALAVARLLTLVRTCLDAGTDVHVFVTHDAVLAPLVSRLLGTGHVAWPDFLATALIWRAGAGLRVWFDGRSQTVRGAFSDADA